MVPTSVFSILNDPAAGGGGVILTRFGVLIIACVESVGYLHVNVVCWQFVELRLLICLN